MERLAVEITDLKSIQAPLKARYREEPQAASRSAPPARSARA